ncbi:MAG TPA: PDZ domain-containing protein [Longimicrobium sp.]|nr:PDZ domain-containing protein [Longimicrobium sp.]
MGPNGVAQVRNYPVVRRLTANSPAARAGVLLGDQIVSANGRDGRRPPLFEDVTPGSRVVLRIRRGGDEREIAFVAGTAPTR